MRGRGTATLLAALTLLAWVRAGGADPSAAAPPSIDRDVTWTGAVRVERTVTVRNGATLTVKPGAVVSFAKGAGLRVEGALDARGDAEAQVRFVPAGEGREPGDWEGIRFAKISSGSILSRCVVLGAAALEVSGPGVRIEHCDIGNGKTGVIVDVKASPEIFGNTIRDMSEAGILCRQESSPRIEGNAIRSCGRAGVACDRNAAPVVRGNDISECDHGISFHGGIPPVEGNVLRKNGTGLLALSADVRQEIRGNRFEGNETGLLCEQFSNPLVEQNSFTGNGAGLVCFRSSSPRIRNNEVSGNELGIVCRQLCRPRIEGNEIHGNGKGIFLTLSSYAEIHGNNIHGNKVQLELGMMSSDWERRTREKPVRGNAAQQTGQAIQMGRGNMAPGQEEDEERSIRNFVDATGNWWGEMDTEEMERKGPDADIAGLVDYHDAPTHPSEGYPGVYEQDRIRYSGWRKAPVPDAGIPGKGVAGTDNASVSGAGGKVVFGGDAAAGARVFAYRSFDDAMARKPYAVSEPSAADGSWRIDLPAGKWYLVAKRRSAGAGDGPLAPGDDFAFHGGNPVSVAPGKVRRVGFTLVRLEKEAEYAESPDRSAGSLGGVVTWNGKPAEGVDVLLYADGRNDFRGIPYSVAAPTGGDGVFLVESLPEAAYYVLARKRSSGKAAGPLADGDTFGFYPENPVPVKAGKVARIRLGVIRRTGAGGTEDDALLAGDTGIAGRILDGDGRPVKGAYAFVYAEKAMSHRRPEHISPPTGEDGRYVLRLPGGGKYFLGARSEYGDTPSPGEWYGRYEGTPDHSIVVPGGKHVDNADVVVERVLR